jgi:hypothetical protein
MCGADVVQGIQTEALQCVGQLGGLDKDISLALGSSGMMDGLVLAQTHENPRIKARETRPCILYDVLCTIYMDTDVF